MAGFELSWWEDVAVSMAPLGWSATVLAGVGVYHVLAGPLPAVKWMTL